MTLPNREETIAALKAKTSYTADDLRTVMTILRGEGGCPWDREQTHQSIRRDFLEETYEALEGIDSGNNAILEEELGDVLLQVVFHAAIAEDEGAFNLDDVTTGICAKLIERHPHVFGDVTVSGSADVLRNWDKIKQEKKEQTTLRETLEGVSKALPALIYAEKLAHKAAKVGRAPQDGSLSLLSDEALGELLLNVAAECDRRDIDGEKLLADTCRAFIERQ